MIGVPVGVTFLDCVGYVARVEGKNWIQPHRNGACLFIGFPCSNVFQAFQCNQL